jgi:hypothetical protein
MAWQIVYTNINGYVDVTKVGARNKSKHARKEIEEIHCVAMQSANVKQVPYTHTQHAHGLASHYIC